MLGLKLPTDPRWVNIVEKNIEDILTDHAYCEQKAASTAISLIVSFPEYTDLVQEMIALVKVSEETNQTEYIFDRLNKQYNTQVQQQSKMLSTLMEPFIILFVGILVGVILIAMYLPMFKLSSVIG